MARRSRVCLSGIPQHIIQRGNNQQVCFGSAEDHAAYVHWLAEASEKYRVAIHAWVLMTNHVHLLATPETQDGLSKVMQIVGRHYVRYFNCSYCRTGTLWEGRFKSCVIDAEDYLLVCQRYIELNPVRTGMAQKPSDYRWSSYHSNALAKKTHLWTPHGTWLQLGKTHQERSAAYRKLFAGYASPDELKKVRDSVNKGLALGNNRFRDEIERLSGRRMRPLKRGPKPQAVADGDDRKQEFLL
ncbi:MAG: transposase [Gammaproteobacteria bacterium]|nr:transposase [Gammaproteobacteria bacterium]